MKRLAIVSCLLVLATACSEDLFGNQAGDGEVSVGSTSSATHTGPEISCGSDEDANRALIQGHLDNGDPIILSSGVCTIRGQLDVTIDSTTIEGAGPDVTQIQFVPTADNQALFRFEDADQLENVTLKNVGLNSGETDPRMNRPKTAIYVHDARNITIENVSIGPWVAPSYQTVGLEIRGRELGTYRKLTIRADVPLRIGANIDEQSPGAFRDNQKDLGHHHFQDMNLVSNVPPNPVVVIEPGVVLRHVTFDGMQAWVHGGLSWIDGTTVARRHSSHLRIANLRVEGICDDLVPPCTDMPAETRPTAIDIQKNTADGEQDPGFPAHLDDLLIEFSLTAGRGIFSSMGGAWHGVRVGGVLRTVLYQVRYEGTSVPVQTDGYGVVMEGP